MHLPAGSVFRWPVFPFYPYTTDGVGPLEQAVAVVTLTPGAGTGELTFEILPETAVAA